jgi:type IV pilus assembly protein PilB
MSRVPRKLGELLIESGIVTEQQLLEALAAQKKERKLLGEIIVDLGFTTKERLDAALARQYGSKLGEILIDKGLISFEQLQTSIDEQKNSEKSLGEILIDKGYVAEADLIEGLAKQYDIPYVKLANYEINPEAIAKVPLDALKKYCVFPINIQDNMLVVATTNPEDVIAESDLRFLSGMYIKFVLASKSDLLSYLE